MKYFVFSDVHGFYNELLEALSSKGFDEHNPEHKLILCGDAFDRGPDNVKLYLWLKDMHEKGKIILVKGNHEELLLNCINQGYYESHDYSNGTVDTIRQFGEYVRNLDISYSLLRLTFKDVCNEIIEKTDLVNFINNNFVNYFETEHYVFVHGFIPVKYSKPDHSDILSLMMFDPDKLYYSDWRNASDYEWEDARWINGMECNLTYGIKEENKKIVFGHWHTAYGHIREKYKDSNLTKYELRKLEFSEESCFDIYQNKDIIALDACTAHTHKVNVLVIED